MEDNFGIPIIGESKYQKLYDDIDEVLDLVDQGYLLLPIALNLIEFLIREYDKQRN